MKPSGQTDFAIHAHNEPCGATGLTCTKSITLHVYQPEPVTYSMLRGRAFMRSTVEDPV